jgi:CDP-glucose 4,6-dehydratase
LLGIEAHPNFTPAAVDLRDRAGVFDLINTVQPEVVFHLGAVATVSACARAIPTAVDVNVVGTLNVVEACRQLRIVQRLVHVSTDHVFGNVREDQVPIPEGHPIAFHGPYDTSKSMAEMLLRGCYAHSAGYLPLWCITRCANAFGYGDTAQRRVIPNFIRYALSDGMIPLTTRRTGRQFIHVLDAVSGYILAAAHLDQIDTKADATIPTFHFSVETYGDGQPFLRIRELADKIATLTGARVIELPGCVDFLPNENPVQGLSCGKARDLLVWRPQIPFDDALADMVRWYRTESEAGRRRLIRAAVEAAADRLRCALDRPRRATVTV